MNSAIMAKPHKEITTIVEVLLEKYDPMGLMAIGAPKNEYCTEAQEIVSNLNKDQSHLSILFMVYRIFIRQFDFITAGSIFNYTSISKELYQLRDWKNKLKTK